MDGRWTGCGRAGAAEIAWEEARAGGARENVRPGGRVLILINIAKKILISIVFQYRVLIFQALKSIRKSIKKASKSQPKINTGTAAKMQVVFQIACL